MVVPHTAWSLTSSIQVSALVFKVSGNACGVRLGQGHTMGHCPRTRGDKQSWVRQVSNHSIPRLKSLIRCCCSVTQSCSTFCDPMDCSTPGVLVLHHLPQLAQTHVHRISDAIQSFHPLSSPSPPAFNLSSIKVFSSESVIHIRWPKYWCFSFSISSSNKHSGLISFRMDWLDLLAVQGTLKSLFQHHSSKASILQHSAFFMV